MTETDPGRDVLLDAPELQSLLSNAVNAIQQLDSWVGANARSPEPVQPLDVLLQQVSTENLLAEVARRMQTPRPFPVRADPPEEQDDETRLLARHADCGTICTVEGQWEACPHFVRVASARVTNDSARATDSATAMVVARAATEPETWIAEPAAPAREITARYHGELQGIQDEKGWAEMEPEALATKVATLRDLLAGGIPADIPITCTPDVLSLYGVDLDEMEAACRMPTRVEVRPELVDKRYAVLAFFRGDLQAIIGFRFPKHPGCMAIYLGSMLEADSHHVEHTGGGGARAKTTLPTTPKQLISRLRGSGATVELDPAHTDGITHKVTFRGEDIGLIKTERQSRSQVQSDYNRLQRKMQAIARQQEAKVG